MKIRHIALKPILSLAFAFVLTMSFSVLSAYAQAPLSLAEVLTGLQSRTGGFSLAEKNTYITQEIQKRGITFRLSTEIENELKRAGASTGLINAIRSKTSTNTPTRVTNPNAPPIVEFDKAWVDYNVTENGEKGMRVHTKFTLRNLKDIPLQLTVRIQTEDGDTLTSTSSAYRNKGGQLAVFRALKPGYENAVFDDYSVFLPYSAFNIAPGKHNLKLDADIIYPDGDLLKHLTLYPFTFTQLAKTTTTPVNNSNANAVLDRMWIDYNVTQGGQKGMLVHTKVTINNLLNQNIQLALGVEKADGTKVMARGNSVHRSVNGQLTFYKDLKPVYASAVFSDIQIFVPYSEITVPAGKHNLRLHADIIQAGTELNVHINYFPFTFTQPSTNNYY